MLIDIGMTVLLFFAMSFQFMEQMNHEIFGTVLFVIFILHHFMNWRWYVNLGKGKYMGTRILTTVIDFIIIIDMFALMKRRFLDYIFGKIHFVLFDYSEPVIFFELDLAAIMILMVVVGYYLQKLISYIGKIK